ncbi:MAG TPA: preprotein translocase subunit YajC [Limnochordia bacterium]|nr:preprotein translocase subunit YajC [Limnochordia bacterium]
MNLYLAATAATGQGSWMGVLMPLIVMGVLFYFLILRPQQRQQRERRNLLDSLRKGDRVVTTGGIFGDIVDVHEEVLDVQIAPSVRIQVARGGIGRVVQRKGEEPAADKGAAEALESAPEAGGAADEEGRKA